MSDQYVWFSWASGFLVPWAVCYLFFPRHRKTMLWSSVFTMPFGLTEPLYVPEYWNPPSLFDLAQTTGFDIESLIFCFAIGGIAAVFYNVATGQGTATVTECERHAPLHRFHYLALSSPFLVFVLLLLFPWNAIYPGIVAMFVGAVAAMLCRPDLRKKTWVGGLLFLACYVVFLQGLRWTVPGYIERVWNLEVLTGISAFGMPLEEILFAVGFGMYWSGIYEHFNWRKRRMDPDAATAIDNAPLRIPTDRNNDTDVTTNPCTSPKLPSF